MRRVSSQNVHRPVRHAADISCQVVRLRDFNLVADRIADLSMGGLLATPADVLTTGEPLIVSFRLPHWGRWLDIEATVARVAHGRRPGDRTRSIGVQFDGLDDRSRRLLELTLKWLPPAPPRTRPGRRNTAGVLRRLVRTSSLPDIFRPAY